MNCVIILVVTIIFVVIIIVIIVFRTNLDPHVIWKKKEKNLFSY